MNTSELSERLEYYGLKAQDPIYASVARTIDRSLSPALDGFYNALRARPQLAGKFADSDAMARARAAQARHWKDAFSQGLEEAFLKRSNHIGGVHARIGLEPRWYFGSYARVLDDLVTAVIAPGWQRLLPWKRAEARRVAALVKVSLLDMDIALSSYFTDISEKVNRLNLVLGEALALLADGKLNIPAVDLPKEYAEVAADFNSTVAALIPRSAAWARAWPRSPQDRARSAPPRTIFPAAPRNRQPTSRKRRRLSPRSSNRSARPARKPATPGV